MARGFSWPPVLPEELRSLPIYEAVTANNEYFDAAIDRLCSKFLKSIPDSTQNRTGLQSKYPATCSAVITPTVREFLDYKVKYGIPAEKLKQLFLDLFTMSAADAAKKYPAARKPAIHCIPSVQKCWNRLSSILSPALTDWNLTKKTN